MPRKYTHVQLLEDEFIRLREEGYTRREIADMFGLDEIQVKNALYRHKKRMETISAPPRRRGRRRKNPITDWGAMERELKHLQMENELLRDFLSETERM